MKDLSLNYLKENHFREGTKLMLCLKAIFSFTRGLKPGSLGSAVSKEIGAFGRASYVQG